MSILPSNLGISGDLPEDWRRKLKELIKLACEHPRNTPQRRRVFNQIIKIIQQSDSLWREGTQYYEDALQKTWLYFALNLCKEQEINTADEPFCSEDCKVIARLNKYLKWRLKDYGIETSEERRKRLYPRVNDDGSLIEPIDMIPAPKSTPNWCDELRIWAETDISGKLRSTCIKGYPEVTCQIIILRRLPPEATWKDIATEFGLPISTLSSFYERKCRPFLREFGQSEGYFSIDGDDQNADR